jgi:hypothetical protein
MITYRKYIWAFLITLIIFLGVTMISNYLDGQRINEVKSIDDSISLDILSSEAQFDLLKQTPCDSLGDSSLSAELDSLGSRLSYLEDTRGTDDTQVVSLKLNYALLEIKDFILTQSLAEKCRTKPAIVLYFYSNQTDCPDCGNAGTVLTALRLAYPNVRVYSFDYHSNLSAVNTLENVYKVKPEFPALVIHDKPTYGLKSLSLIESLMPELASMKAASTTAASSTPRR